ncbi:Hsp70 family protein [Aspergillus lucknowensis]|uniref:Uncharacterized protein n=1 Tax=Aspergillus lucknowensis TaxID=176173 RepID=A0ABR4LUC5_9EURO
MQRIKARIYAVKVLLYAVTIQTGHQILLLLVGQSQVIEYRNILAGDSSTPLTHSEPQLLLDADAPLTDLEDRALDRASNLGIFYLPRGKDAVQVVGNYPREIHGHLPKILRVNGQNLPPLDIILPMPATWSAEPKARLEFAARSAGFGARDEDTLRLVTEPEAAACAVLHQNFQTLKLRLWRWHCGEYHGPVFEGEAANNTGCLIQKDIGKFVITNTHPKLNWVRIISAQGARCGGAAVDSRFYQLMSERFQEAFDEVPLKQKGPGSAFMKIFEDAKARVFG